MSTSRKKSVVKNLASLAFDVNEELQCGDYRDASRDLNWVPQFNPLEPDYPYQYQQQQNTDMSNQVSINYQNGQDVFVKSQQSELRDPAAAYENCCSSLSSVQAAQDVPLVEKPAKNVTGQNDFNCKPTDSVIASLSISKGKDLKLLMEPEMTLKQKIEFVKSADFSKRIPMRKGPPVLEEESDEDENDEYNDDKENAAKNISELRECLICNRKYANNSYFRLHCREIHNLCVGPKRCQKMCTLCGSTFSTEDSYQDHEQQTKSNLIYCLEKVQALKSSSKANANKNFKNVSAIELQLMSNQNKRMKLSK